MLLDFHEVDLNEEIEKEIEKIKLIRNVKRELGRNRDFRCIINNVGKGEKIGLISSREENFSRNEGIAHHNKKDIKKY